MSAPWIAAFMVLWTFTLFLAVVFVGQLRRVTNFLRHAEFRLELASAATGGLGGLPPGTKVPPFFVEGEDGEIVASHRVLTSPTVVLFLGEHCAPCESLVSELANARLPEDLRLVAFVDGNAITPPDGIGVSVFRQISGSASRAFSNVASPQAFAVDAASNVVDRLIPDSVDELIGLWKLLGGGGVSLGRGVVARMGMSADGS
jgi:hypothetical protein